MSYQPGKAYIRDGIVQLPHSCSEWEIGTLEDLRCFMRDLQSLVLVLTHEVQGVPCMGTWGQPGSRGWSPCTALTASPYSRCGEHRET